MIVLLIFMHLFSSSTGLVYKILEILLFATQNIGAFRSWFPWRLTYSYVATLLHLPI